MRIFDYVWNDTNKLSDVAEEVIDMISTVYQENSPELIYLMIFCGFFIDEVAKYRKYDEDGNELNSEYQHIPAQQRHLPLSYQE